MEWISVKECLPDEGEPVLVNSQYWSANPFVARRIRGEWEGERILSRPDSVTHWMPLPPPPTAPETETK